jgi:hypothetical protein
MNRADATNDIIHGCLENIRHLLGKQVIAHIQQTGQRGPDVKLVLPTQPRIELVGECKTNIATRAQALNAVLQARAYAGKNAGIVILAKWIPEAVAQELREAGVDFADTFGNAYFRHPPQLLIDIRGKRPEARLAPEPGRIVEAGGLKICHLLLTQPQVLKEPLRVIAEQANVALATAHAVMRELMLARLLLPGPGRERRLGDAKELVETFVRGYALKLRPACLIGRYRHRRFQPKVILEAAQQVLMNTQARWAVTGGMAAKQLTGHLEPDNVTLFVDEQAEQHLKKMEPLLPDKNGNLTLLRLFADTAIGKQATQEFPLATPLLVYADLLNEGGPREVETARMICDKWVKPEGNLG